MISYLKKVYFYVTIINIRLLAYNFKKEVIKMFPKCFPTDFEKRLLPVKRDKCVKSVVYRVIKWGKIDRKAFLSTYEEVLMKLRPQSNSDDESSAGYYATSTNLDESELQYYLRGCLRRDPAAFIAKGVPLVKCGPSQLSRERDNNIKGNHVDWWIYELAQPELKFERSECK